MIKLTIDPRQSRLQAEATRERLIALGLPQDLDAGTPNGRAAIEKLSDGPNRGPAAIAEVAPLGVFDYNAASKLRKKRWMGSSCGLERASTEAARALALVARGLEAEMMAARPKLEQGLDAQVIERVARRASHLLLQLDLWLPNETAKNAAASEPAALEELRAALAAVCTANAVFAAALSKSRSAALGAEPPPSEETRRAILLSIGSVGKVLMAIGRLADHWSAPVSSRVPSALDAIHTLATAPEIDGLDRLLSGPALTALFRLAKANDLDPDAPSWNPPRAPELHDAHAGQAPSLSIADDGLRLDHSERSLTSEELARAGWTSAKLADAVEAFLLRRFGADGLTGLAAAEEAAQKIEDKRAEIDRAYAALSEMPELFEILRLESAAFARGIEVPLAAYAVKSSGLERIAAGSQDLLYAEYRIYKGRPYAGRYPWVRAAIDKSGLVMLNEKNQLVDRFQLYRAGLTPSLLQGKILDLNPLRG